MIEALVGTGDYRVLRRLKHQVVVNEPDGEETRLGLFLDVETTGLDVVRDELIELAMVTFDYSKDGKIYRIYEPFQGFNEPTDPIPVEITALTGITDTMVRGQRLARPEIEALVTQAALVIAHNAAFDRPFAERISPLFREKPWACSMCEIEWNEEGIEGRRLSDLLARYGWFFDSHRASDDCQAAIKLLSMKLPRSGRLAMSALLERARTATYRLAAEGAPFAAREELKARGYRWNGDERQGPRAWRIEVVAERVEAELAFLESEIFKHPVQIPIQKITAYERFSGVYQQGTTERKL